MRLYQTLADSIAQQIQQQTLQTGEKLPGTRTLAKHHGVSINTVIEAQKLLEQRGLVEAKPRSGFYVCYRSPAAAATEPTHFKPAPALVKNQQLVLDLLQATQNDDLLPLGAALPNPSFLPTDSLRKTISRSVRHHADDFNRYSFPPGLLALRRQIAKRMFGLGCNVGADDIVVTNGCHEAVLLALKAVTKAGDVVALESPTYYGLLQAVDSLQLKALEIPTDPVSGIDLDALERACKQWHVKACVIVSNFSNPLGSCPSVHRKKALLALLDNHDVPLVEDDIYGDLASNGERPAPIKQFDTTGNVLYCNSFSKTLSPGLRIGWIAPGRFTEQINYLKFTQSLATSTLEQQVLADYLASGQLERHLRRLRDKLATQIARTRQLVLEHFPKGTRVSDPKGGFVVWVTLPEGCDAMQLHEKASEQGISIAPGSLFTTGDLYGNCFRINCAQPWDVRYEQGLTTLARLVS